jgi:uncharacterized protein YndB with AHSA1/START domain
MNHPATASLSAVTAHGQFTIVRHYAASPARVWAAWADIDVKARWFIGPERWELIERRMDLRVGGEEVLRGRFADGALPGRCGGALETQFSARYHLVEPGQRMVYVYDMHLNGNHHSVSLATVEFAPEGAGCQLRFTEQVVFVDGTQAKEGTASRDHGTAVHLDRIATVLG